MTKLRLLGPVEASNGAGPVDLGGARPTRVLVALFTTERHRLDLDALVERSFDDADRPDDPVPAVRTAVRRLRRALGNDAVATRPGGYELEFCDLDVDIDAFDELIAAGRATADPVAAATVFRRALDLWRGRPFGELGNLDWLTPERVRLEAAHLMALEGWHDANLRNGAATEIIPSLEAATVEHPMRERFHRQLMQALFLADRQPDALRAFQTYRTAMIESGLEPGLEIVTLERRIAQDDPSLRTETSGRPLRGYRIVERVGEGAFSIVYRGTQPSVARDVAIKQIRAELANRPDFIRRFEAEAHMVAHLEHPFVVPLYDYWREPGSAYLVMRLLPGGSLESSVLDGPWDVERTARMVSQVGAALSAAHRAGVVHRDVKSANILLDDESNSYLTDFGIALTEAELVDPASSLSAGSPAYASPEQLRREPVGPPADVHGLAIAVYEALTGRLPFPDEPTNAALLHRQLHDPIPPVSSSRADIPSAVDDVIQRATAKPAADRFQSMDDFVAAFETAAGARRETPTRPGTATVIPAEERNPYKGLRAFDEPDAGDFAGRDRLVDQLVTGLASNRVLAVVGPSGSGKSSAVRAGLLPALRRGAVRDSTQWFVSTVVPGAHPDEELEAALLRVAAHRPPGLVDVLRDGDRGISRALRQVLPDGGQLLLVIDQFEEIFTLCDDEGARRRFLDGLAAAVTEERARLHVVLTLRADFFDRPLLYESFGRLVRDATVPVLPLAADELERAILEPAQSVGAEFEPGLVSEIVADVADQPGALPLLQYALTELYDRRVSNLLTRDAYRAIGGVTGALAARAEELYEASDAVGRLEMRRLFGRLVTLGEGTEDTRRRVIRRELGDSEAVRTTIDRLGDARLLSFDRDPATREPTVEVAHEALLREWPRLRRWLDDDRDGLRIHRHLTDTGTAWLSSGRDVGELYRGGRLEAAATWAADRSDDLNETEREFLVASVAQRAAERETEQQHLGQQVRSNRRLRVLVGVATVIAVVAAIAGLVAFRERGNAQDAAEEAGRNAAAAQANAAQADANAETADTERAKAEQAAFEADVERMVALAPIEAMRDPSLGLLIAAEAHRAAGTIASEGGLQRSLVAVPRGWVGSLWGRGGYTSVTVVDDSKVVAGGAGGVDVFDIDTAQLTQIEFGDAPVLVAAVSGLVAVGSSAGDWAVYGDKTWDRLHDGTESESITALALSPSGDQLAIGRADGSATIRHLSGGADVDVGVVYESGDVLSLAWDSGSTRVLLGGGIQQPARLVDAETGVQIGTDMGVAGDTLIGSGDVAWMGDQPVVTNVRTARFDADSTTQVGESIVIKLGAIGSRDPIVVVDDRTLLSVSSTVFRVDFDSAAVDVVLDTGHIGTVVDAQLFDDGTVLAVATEGSIELLDLDAVGPIADAVPAVGPSVTVNDAGTIVTSSTAAADPASLPGATVAWDVSSRSVLKEFPAAFAIRDEDGLMLVHPWAPGEDPIDHQLWWYGDESTRTIPGHSQAAIGTSPDRRLAVVPVRFPAAQNRLAAEVDDYPVLIHDTETGELITWLDHFSSRTDVDDTFSVAQDVEFTPDGSRMVISAQKTGSAVWDTETWELIQELDARAGFFDVDFSADGTIAAAVDAAGNLTLRDPNDLSVVGGPIPAIRNNFVGGGNVVTISDDLSTVMVSESESARLYDVATLEPIGGPFEHQSIFWTAQYASAGELLVTHVDGEIVMWNADRDQWLDIACRAAGRNMTRLEWEEFGLSGFDYRATCPQFSIES